ncbi:type II secretion system F family protein [Trinickia sp. Y13]|uniref:type II secretion system F family protein n=1 Tax=Trinickia sp. Y13 TaxID=2917807 RepID=UPI002404B5C6|nr:type II secretion system F family protein [Trinickia sp. Y13]MDG0022850.1 type II secretion system F family protein [Trinickia sp. Y13]
MQTDRLFALALALGVLGCLLLAYVVLLRMAAARRGARMLAHALERRAAAAAAAPASAGELRAQAAGSAPPMTGQRRVPAAAALPTSSGPPTTLAARVALWRVRFGHAGVRWLDTPLGKHIVASEDRRLIEQCGFIDADARGFFLLSRLVCALAIPPLASWLWSAYVPAGYHVAFVAAAFVAGFMLPKFALGRRAAMRRNAVADEMPVLVDLLRLLQGVGLSLDQSLQVIVNDFRSMLPVLCGELEHAQRQFAAGRTREQSLQRLGTSFDNEDLRAIVRLMIQVDRHGGAVQEPLKQFGDRLRETRRARLREKIGHLTVKMTGVMIVTLLPALLIVTAGPGLLAIMRSLATVHR